MKRSSFKRPEYVRPPPSAPTKITRGVQSMVTDEVRAAPKDDPIQHESYMRLVRKLPCAHCGIEGPNQFCHSDEGKGTGIKSDCRLGWPGCGPRVDAPGCHYLIGTQRIYPKEERRALEARMARETRDRIRLMGLWPKGLPAWPGDESPP